MTYQTFQVFFKTMRAIAVLRHSAALLALAVLAACAGQAVAPTPAAPPPNLTQNTAQPGDAKEILMGMARFLANTRQFSVSVQANYDVVQESGEKIEFAEIRKVTVSRPDGLRVESEHSDGEKHWLLYDGKQITAYSPTHQVYAQIDKPGGIDAAVTYFLKDLHMRLPLAAMLLGRLPEELENRTESLSYVETTSVHGVSSHHLAGRTESVDYQIWVTAGAQPLPVRVVLTYPNAAGQPAFRAEFSDWNLAPPITADMFAFVPPAGARKIAFVAELPQLLPAAATTRPETTGGAQ